MKRKILEVTEIDCGEHWCDGCQFIDRVGMNCKRFDAMIDYLTDRGMPMRLPECLEAERAYKEHPFFDPTQTIYPPKRGFGPPDSIGE